MGFVGPLTILRPHFNFNLMRDLHIDLETYGEVDIMKGGTYRYVLDKSFEILILCFAFDDEPVRCVDIALGQTFPTDFIEALTDPNVRKWAHNATFERLALYRYGYEIPIDQIHCTSVRALRVGLPASLGDICKVMQFEDSVAKLKDSGNRLINYFSVPCKPTKANGGRLRNHPHHDPDKWEEFKYYCIRDVIAEREVHKRVPENETPFEREMYILDQKINDRGIKLDVTSAQNALDQDNRFKKDVKDRLIQFTGLSNPNSGEQFKSWLLGRTGLEVKSVDKDNRELLKKQFADDPAVSRGLEEFAYLKSTSTSKFKAMLSFAIPETQRGHGFFQFYGASKTGRWAGRGVQPQNLPQNHLDPLDYYINHLRFNWPLEKLTDDVPSALSQLVRPCLISDTGKSFVVADYSAIEARVLAWLAGEQWRIDTFNQGGDIYVTSAAKMFHLDPASIDKSTEEGSSVRAKGKVAELAFGYQGGAKAIANFDKKGAIPESEKKPLVKAWRAQSPSIVSFWENSHECAMRAIKTKRPIISPFCGSVFEMFGNCLTISLPSGRKLFYPYARIGYNQWDSLTVLYKGVEKGRFVDVSFHGGKIVQNITQATARDVIAYAMVNLDNAGFNINLHVHDEIASEEDDHLAEEKLSQMVEIMAVKPEWAEGLPLRAEGFVSKYYKK